MYDATGTKLKKAIASSVVKKSDTTYYAGNMVYNKSKKLLFVITDEGRAVKYGNGFTYEYDVKDHLGNVRIVLKDTLTTPVVAQENHYYPFGLVMQGLGTVDKTSPKNNFLFNGKEQQTDFGVDWGDDFGARFKDKFSGRWWVIDPMCEKYRRWSPYNFCVDNPLRFIDPDGKDIITHDEESRKNIYNTLTKADRKFIKFDKNGHLDNKLISKAKSGSGNFNALKQLALSSQKYNFHTSIEYKTLDDKGNTTSMPLQDDKNKGTIGVTCVPNAKEDPSIDSEVHIYTSSKLSTAKQAENLSHEAYAHALLYDNKEDYTHNKRPDLNQPHTYFDQYLNRTVTEYPIFRDNNTKLDNLINQSVNETKKNIQEQ